MDDLVEKTTEFLMENTTYTNRSMVKFIVSAHLKYKTCIISMKDNDVVGFCRWNILSDNETAELLDLVVRNDYYRRGLMKEIADNGFPYWPHIKYIQFERGYDDGKQIKKKKRYLVQQLWRRMQHANNLFGGSSTASGDAKNIDGRGEGRRIEELLVSK